MLRNTQLRLGWLVALVVIPGAERSQLIAATLIPEAERDVRTYRFTARVNDNGGLTPFKVGETVQGTVTYDLRAIEEAPARGVYQSKRNAFTIRLRNTEIQGVGPVAATVGTYKHAEHFQVVASDLKLPQGWDMDHRNVSSSFGVVLQNAPSRKVMSKTLPEKVRLADFKNTRELLLDFYGGVKFPGGEVKEKATVSATLEEFEEVRPGGR